MANCRELAIGLKAGIKGVYGAGYRYSYTLVIVFGILENILLILSILRQKKNILKNNYYFLVSHLAICDLAALILYLSGAIELQWLKEPLPVHSSIVFCHVYGVAEDFQLAGLGMMLIISLLRYHATVHPLKPAISRRKLKVVCGLVYLVGFIVAGGVGLPLCFIKSNVALDAVWKFYCAFFIFFVYFVPTKFMAVVYNKIGRSLIKQNKYMKRVLSNLKRQREPDSSFDILRYIRNRRTFFVCLGTVLCYGVAYIPLSVYVMWLILGEYHLAMKFGWVVSIGNDLRIAGSHSANPFIYGILDKKMLTLWKCCCKKKRRTQEN